MRRLLLILALLAIAVAACADASDNSSNNTTSNTANDQPVTVANSGDASLNDLTRQEPTAQPLAAIVDGEPITMVEFKRERERRALGLAVEPATAAAFDASVLQTMIDQTLIEQEAGRRGIVVAEEEIDAEIALQETLVAANGQTLEEVVAAQLYTIDDYRAVIADTLLTQKVADVVADVPAFTEQVHSRHILVADEATARSLLAQIQQGADFAQLAFQYSLDSSTSPTGGDLDWVSRGDLLQQEVEDAIFALQSGELSPEPVRSSLGYHVVQTLERVQDRPLSQAALALKKQQAFVEWLENQRAVAVIEIFLGSE